MIPYSDSLSRSGFTLKGSPATAALVVLLLIVHFSPWFSDRSTEAGGALGFIPAAFSAAPWHIAPVLLASTFLHVDVFQVAGTCFFLWIFGRTLERLFGSMIFLAIFPVLGVAGLLLQWLIDPVSGALAVGPSAAISSLVGAYVVLFRSARIKIATLGVSALKVFTAPAWSFLLFWAALQLLSLMFGSGQEDGRAYAVAIACLFAGAGAASAWRVLFPSADRQLESFVAAAHRAQALSS